jgi:hypothetical protein
MLFILLGCYTHLHKLVNKVGTVVDTEPWHREQDITGF